MQKGCARHEVMRCDSMARTKRLRLVLLACVLLWLVQLWSSLPLLESFDKEHMPESITFKAKTRTAVVSSGAKDRHCATGHTWKPVTGTEWCQMSSPTRPGLIYVKVPKAASSTLAGINMRIARKVGARNLKSSRQFLDTLLAFVGAKTSPKTCGHTKYHGRTPLLERNRAKKESTLLWTFLRDPKTRAISEFYHFQVSRQGVDPTSARLAQFLQSQKGYQWNYIIDHENAKELRHADLVDNSQSIIQRYFLDAYNFIGLVERKEESLAVMKLLWNLQDKDLIVLSAKQSGQYDDGRSNATCTKIQKPKALPNNTRNVLTNNFRRNNYDYLLYEAVNRSLDCTIDNLGRNVVEQQVQRIRYLQRVAEANCQNKAVFPCSSNGTRQHELSVANCYLYDSGCGYRCVDRMLESY